jgi:ketosteroid isomerase-like protein
MRGRWALAVAAVIVVTFAVLRLDLPERSTSAMTDGATPRSDPYSEEQLRVLIRAWDGAYAQHDTNTLSRILADDYGMVDADGQFVNRTEYLINVVKAAPPEGDGSASSGLLVRVYGETAVVTGRSRAKGVPRGRLHGAGAEVVFTDVFVRSGDGWRAVATHASPAGRQVRP